MIKVVWIILQRDNRFLLAQRALTDCVGGTWCLPGGKVDEGDQSDLAAAKRELQEEVGIVGNKFHNIFHFHSDKYYVQCFLCSEWSGLPCPSCDDIVGVGWFTLSEMYALGQLLSPFVNNALPYLAYTTQHYGSHPEEAGEDVG